MKIDQLNAISNARQTQATERVKPLRQPKASPPIRTGTIKPSSEPDAVYISGRAEAVAKLVTRVSGLAEVRPERVESLRAAVTSGVYDPSSEQIADSIISDEKELSK